MTLQQEGATPRPLGLALLTVSDTRTLETDTSGAVVVEFAASAGHCLVARRILPDDAEVLRACVAGWLEDASIEVVIVTGGTGITGRDVTPEALGPLVTKSLPGFGELFRMLSYAEIGPAALQSRAFAGLCGKTLLFALPGSTGAVRLAVESILRPQLDVRTRPCNFAEMLPRLAER
jgi:molybdenum cofactor biosynthesis protein B